MKLMARRETGKRGVAEKTIGDPRAHYVELDALRGIAILGVVMSHIAASWRSHVAMPLMVPLLGVDAVELFFFGTYGVTLFFLLSGYLLTWTEEKRARLGTYSVRSYALRRTLRLVPAYYAALLFVVVWWLVQAKEVSVIDVLLHVLFLHGLNPQYSVSLDPAWWSLTPEVIFYLLLPFIVLKLPRASQRLGLFGVCALVALGPPLYAYMMQVVLPSQGSLFWYALFEAMKNLYVFLAGVLLRMLVEYLNSRPGSWLLQLRLATALFLVSAVATVALLYLGLKHPILAGLRGDASAIVSGIPFRLLVIAFFASAVLGSPLLRAVLRWRFLAFTGVISYSLFLLHHTVLSTVTKPYFSAAVRDWVPSQDIFGVGAAVFVGYALATLALAFIVSYFSYRYVESPFLSHKPK